MKKTKIVCTIGPSSNNEEMLRKMIAAGMNVARFNFSHGSHQEQLTRINMVKQVREKLKCPLAILLDTKGPEIRFKKFEGGKIEIKEGDSFTLTTEDILGNNTVGIPTFYPLVLQFLYVCSKLVQDYFCSLDYIFTFLCRALVVASSLF